MYSYNNTQIPKATLLIIILFYEIVREARETKLCVHEYKKKIKVSHTFILFVFNEFSLRFDCYSHYLGLIIQEQQKHIHVKCIYIIFIIDED